MKHLLLLLFPVLLCLGASAQQQCDTVPLTVDTATFKAMLEKHDGVLIDVRTPQEWANGHIKGAINIDFRSPDFEKKIMALDKKKTYYLYCATGARSGSASKFMLEHGFCKVIVLHRGLHAWEEAHYPVKKS